MIVHSGLYLLVSKIQTEVRYKVSLSGCNKVSVNGPSLSNETWKDSLDFLQSVIKWLDC